MHECGITHVGPCTPDPYVDLRFRVANARAALRDLPAQRSVPSPLQLNDFPHAPPGSYVCPEGWLVVGNEAWTLAEWLVAHPQRPSRTSRPPVTRLGATSAGNRYASEDERREARRLTRHASYIRNRIKQAAR